MIEWCNKQPNAAFVHPERFCMSSVSRTLTYLTLTDRIAAISVASSDVIAQEMGDNLESLQRELHPPFPR